MPRLGLRGLGRGFLVLGRETGTPSSQRSHCSFWNLLPSGATLLPLALPTTPCCQPAGRGLLGKTSPSLGLQVTEHQTMTELLSSAPGTPAACGLSQRCHRDVTSCRLPLCTRVWMSRKGTMKSRTTTGREDVSVSVGPAPARSEAPCAARGLSLLGTDADCAHQHLPVAPKALRPSPSVGPSFCWLQVRGRARCRQVAIPSEVRFLSASTSGSREAALGAEGLRSTRVAVTRWECSSGLCISWGRVRGDRTCAGSDARGRLGSPGLLEGSTPKWRGLETTETYSLAVLEARCPNSGSLGRNQGVSRGSPRGRGSLLLEAVGLLGRWPRHTRLCPRGGTARSSAVCVCGISLCLSL